MRNLSLEQEKVRVAPVVPRTVIRAVAGAGKTRLLIERAQYLIGQRTEPKRIWFLVFSRAARSELHSRLQHAKLHCEVQTIHSFCLRELGGKERVRILTDQDTAWKDILSDLEVSHSWTAQKVTQALTHTWHQPSEALTPAQQGLREDAERRIQALNYGGVQHFTFTQMLLEVQTRWQNDPKALTAVQAQFDYLIVDEVQDVTPLQVALIEQLAGNRPLLTVGDAWQSIFSFQGAAVDVLDELAGRADQVFNLDINYRCPAQHLLLAEALTEQVIVPAKGFDGSLAVVRLSSPLELIDVLQDAVSTLVRTDRGGTPVAVLVPTNAEVTHVTALLRERGLVVQSSNERSEEDAYCREVLWPVVAYLIGHEHPRGPHPLLMLGLQGAKSQKRDLDLLHAAWRTQRHVSEVQGVLKGLNFESLFQVWTALSDWHGTPADLLTLVMSLLPSTRNLEIATEMCRRAQDLNDLAKNIAPLIPEDTVDVRVSTIHAAKGREWPCVVLYDADHGSRRSSDPADEQEAVRLRYVALTRSTRDLVAIFHRECHPAYAKAVDPQVLARIRRFESAFTSDSLRSINDNALAADLKKSASIQRYVQQFSAAHLTTEIQERVKELAGLSGESRILEATKGPNMVQRIPLTGLKKSHPNGAPNQVPSSPLTSGVKASRKRF